VPRSRMCGAVPLLPNTPSWHGAQLKKCTGTTLPLPFILIALDILWYASIFFRYNFI
jgi:hypothetical protein